MTQQQSKTEKKVHPFEKLVDRLAPALIDVSAGQIDPARLSRLVLNAGMKNPLLFECTAKSVAAGLMTAAALGIEPNTPLQHCSLVPFKNSELSEEASIEAKRQVFVYEAQFIMGYKGFIYLASETNSVTSVTCHAVYEGEEYEITAGTPTDTIVHKPNPKALHDDKDYGKLIPVVYAVLHVPKGPPVVQWMFREQIELIRTRDRARKASWRTDYGQMAKKTVIKRAMQLIPMGPKLALAIEVDGRSAVGAAMDDLFQLPENTGADDQNEKGQPTDDPGPGERMKEGIKTAREKNDALAAKQLQIAQTEVLEAGGRKD